MLWIPFVYVLSKAYLHMQTSVGQAYRFVSGSQYDKVYSGFRDWSFVDKL